jgi:glycosyltransferase involved in cell wall biosynthesis
MAMRQLQLLLAYCRWATVELVTFYREPVELAALAALRAHCERIHSVPLATTRVEADGAGLPRWRRILRASCTWRPSMITAMFSPEMARIVASLAASCDLIHVARLHMSAQLAGLPGRGRPRTVLDLDDVETRIRLSKLLVFSEPPGAHRLYDWYDLARLWRYQQRALRRFDRVLVCSELDRRRLGGGNVVVVPNGFDVPARLPRNDPDGRTILFCGVLSYAANADAMSFFIERILPEVRKHVPDVRLLIVGRSPSPRMRAWHDGRAILVEGDVPSVTEHYRQATIAVVPLRVGGGTRIKILEAWAYGLPVVSTTVGCEGLDAVDGQHVLVADDPPGFAERCVRLLRAPAERARLIEQGWALVSRRYRWDAVASEAVAALRPLVDAPLAPPPGRPAELAGAP